MTEVEVQKAVEAPSTEQVQSTTDKGKASASQPKSPVEKKSEVTVLPNGQLSTGDKDIDTIKNIDQIVEDTAKRLFFVRTKEGAIVPVQNIIINGSDENELVRLTSGNDPVFHDKVSYQARRFLRRVDARVDKLRLGLIASSLNSLTEMMNRGSAVTLTDSTESSQKSE